MRGAIFFAFFALFLLFLALLAGHHSDSRMDTSVRVFSLSVFFVVVCTMFLIRILQKKKVACLRVCVCVPFLTWF